MPTLYLTFRVEAEVKATLVAAAAASTQTLGDFIVTAALKAADAVMPPQRSPLEHFEAVCRLASGGGVSYSDAGRHLRLQLQRSALAADFLTAVEAGDDSLLDWLGARCPDYLALVPPWRRRIFLRGLRGR